MVMKMVWSSDRHVARRNHFHHKQIGQEAPRADKVLVAPAAPQLI